MSVIMTTEVLCVGPLQTTEECMAIMTENRVRHLPVIDNGTLIGLVSIGDLVKDIISEQQFIIEQLEHYITAVTAELRAPRAAVSYEGMSTTTFPTARPLSTSS